MKSPKIALHPEILLNDDRITALNCVACLCQSYFAVITAIFKFFKPTWPLNSQVLSSIQTTAFSAAYYGGVVKVVTSPAYYVEIGYTFYALSERILTSFERPLICPTFFSGNVFENVSADGRRRRLDLPGRLQPLDRGQKASRDFRHQQKILQGGSQVATWWFYQHRLSLITRGKRCPSLPIHQCLSSEWLWVR